MAVLGLRLCASCGKWGPLFIAVRGPLTIAASPAAEHRLQTRRLSNCGSQAQPLRGMWDPPRPGLEPVSPALAGRLSTTAPPGKPPRFFLYNITSFEQQSKLHPKMQPIPKMLLIIYNLLWRKDWNKTILGKGGSEIARILNIWVLKDIQKPYIAFYIYIYICSGNMPSMCSRGWHYQGEENSLPHPIYPTHIY